MDALQLHSAIVVKTISEEAKRGVFEIEGLFAGYGMTVGNSFRRTLLSSLQGAAITEFKVKNAPHEFSTLPGVQEDLVELLLNFKRLRFRMHTDEPHVLALKVKGEKTVTAADIQADAEVELMNPEEIIAHLTAKDAEIDIELKVERGLGYSPVEARKAQGRLPIGTIAVDAIFTPVLRVNYTVDNMRVGERTDYNRLRLEIDTDGSVSPSSALAQAVQIMRDHFEKISESVVVQKFEAPAVEPKEAKSAKKKMKKTKGE
ncbi:MAG: DNA-directed RNA polymerase subunit alpha [Candidatus Liptonbacteria bacterium]|nr:DNA-directed RNA polymerase subunit alpha [Candidatus Liptonbacteria bacterium]